MFYPILQSYVLKKDLEHFKYRNFFGIQIRVIGERARRKKK